MSQADAEPITADTFAAFATWLGTPLPENPIRALRILRAEVAREIERLIVFLDATGGDPDLEDGHDDEEEPNEPSLGWTSTLNQASGKRFGDVFSDVDLEHEHDGREPDVDREPSLGSRNAHTGFTLVGGGLIDPGIDQTSWSAGNDSDLEEADGDDEDGGDREPWIGR
jgi:hypothetical protein